MASTRFARARITRSGRLRRARGAAILAAGLLATAGVSGEPVELPVPEGVLAPEIPADNEPTTEKVELGRKLYFDTRISADGTVSCASCHDPRAGFADPRGKTSPGVGGALGTRNAPTVLNAAFQTVQFWDGRSPTLEDQAMQPLINAVEHGFESHDSVIQHVREIEEYEPLFEAAFGSPEIDIDRVARAIASFERTLLSLDAPIDRYLAGDESALSESAKRGWELFNGKARCNTCHGHIEVLPLFTDELFHNIGVGVDEVDFETLSRQAAAAVAAGESIGSLGLTDKQKSELGRFVVTGEVKDMGAFKTPQLRNVSITAPYMHNGSEATLAQVVEYYDRGGNPNPYLDGGMRPLNLTDQEKADLVALMESFTSSDLDRFEALTKLMPE